MPVLCSGALSSSMPRRSSDGFKNATALSVTARSTVFRGMPQFVARFMHSTSEGHDPAQVTVVRDQLRRGLTSLTGQQRAVLVLRIFEGYDDAAIADVLHCSQATVRSHASRGLGRLRDFLATDEGGVR